MSVTTKPNTKPTANKSPIAQSTATAPTAEQQREAEHIVAASKYDNIAKGADLIGLFNQAYQQDTLGTVHKANATQEAAYVCLLVYQLIYGQDASKSGAMGKLSKEAAEKDYDQKGKAQFINDVCNRIGLVNPAQATILNAETKSRAITDWNSKRALITSGLEFACMLVVSGQQPHMAGYVATWFDEKTMRFNVRWDALLTKGARPLYELDDMVNGNPEANIKANPDYMVALDDRIYTERKTSGETIDFKANAKRVREASLTKIDTRDMPIRITAKGAPQGTQQTTTQRPGTTPPAIPTPTPTAGRTVGTASTDNANRSNTMGLVQMLNESVAILSEKRPRTGDPKDMFWTSLDEKTRIAIENTERVLRLYRETLQHAEKIYNEEKTKVDAENASIAAKKLTLNPPAPSTVKSDNAKTA